MLLDVFFFRLYLVQVSMLFRVDGARHEFSALDGVEEDVTTIILNIKDLVLKITSEDDDTPKAFNYRC